MLSLYQWLWLSPIFFYETCHNWQTPGPSAADRRLYWQLRAPPAQPTEKLETGTWGSGVDDTKTMEKIWETP